MKKPRYLIMALACLSISFLGTAHCDAAAIGNATYGLLSETYDGIDFNPNGTTRDLGYLGAWVWPDSSTKWPVISGDTTTYTEGGNSLKIVIPDTSYCGIYIQFGSSTTGQKNIDMTAYDGGSLDFDVRSNCDLEIKIEWGAPGTYASVKLSKPVDPNVWQHVSIPLSSFTGIDLLTIRCPAVISPHGVTYSEPGRRYLIDNVVWRKASGGGV